jgi:hypothetical protein
MTVPARRHLAAHTADHRGPAEVDNITAYNYY